MPLPFRFPALHFRGAANTSRIGAWYRRSLHTHPFLLFGLPFVATVVAGSFFLTPVTAVRYEKHDRKNHMLDSEQSQAFEELRKKGKMRARTGGKWDIREEYWRLAGREKEWDDWEPVRVKRLPGEPDGTFD